MAGRFPILTDENTAKGIAKALSVVDGTWRVASAPSSRGRTTMCFLMTAVGIKDRDRILIAGREIEP